MAAHVLANYGKQLTAAQATVRQCCARRSHPHRCRAVHTHARARTSSRMLVRPPWQSGHAHAAHAQAAMGKRPLDCWQGIAQDLDLDVPAQQLLAETDALLQLR